MDRGPRAEPWSPKQSLLSHGPLGIQNTSQGSLSRDVPERGHAGHWLRVHGPCLGQRAHCLHNGPGSLLIKAQVLTKPSQGSSLDPLPAHRALFICLCIFWENLFTLYLLRPRFVTMGHSLVLPIPSLFLLLITQMFETCGLWTQTLPSHYTDPLWLCHCASHWLLLNPYGAFRSFWLYSTF